MIHTIRTVAVGDQESKIDSPIILYRGDREVEVEFTINGSKFTFTNGGNVIKSTNATHGQLVINTPTGENMFSEVTECHNGKVVFVITKEMIDELIEVGFYSFQIRLFDESQVSRVTIPPVLKGIDIRNPIAAEDETNVVDIALVDYSVIVKDEFEDLSTFLPDGNYNKTEWESKDVISGAKLNKIEDALYNINSNMEATDLALLNRIERISNDGVGNRLDALESVNADSRLDALESVNADNRLDALESVNADSRLDALESVNADSRLDVLEGVNADSRLGALEGVNADSRLNELDSEINILSDKLFDTYLSVRDFGAVGDGVTDDTYALQTTLTTASNLSKRVYIPTGTYLITSGLNCENIIKIEGVSKTGSRKTTIVNRDHSSYAITFPLDENSSCEICGLNIESKYGIDARSNAAHIIKNINIHDCVFKPAEGGGICIHFNNTDFSTITNNYFEGGSMCAIRLSGYIENTNLVGNKSSTATQIKGNAFFKINQCNSIGISVEQCDSIVIEENDFCNYRYPVDIGGAYYYQNKIGTNGNYKRGESDNDKAIGCTTNIIISKNHIESYYRGIIVDGGGIANTHDTKILYNNIQTPLDSSEAIRLQNSPWNTLIEHNEIDLKDMSSAIGINVAYANRTFIGLNTIYGVTNNHISCDSNSGYQNTVWYQTEPGKKRDELHWQTPRLKLGRVSTQRLEFPSEIAAYPNGGEPEMYYTTFKNYHELGSQSSGVLVDYPTCKYIMGVVRGVIYSSLGVRAFYLLINGGNIENDMISHDGFEFYTDNYGVKIKNITPNQVSTYLMGVFEVYKF